MRRSAISLILVSFTAGAFAQSTPSQTPASAAAAVAAARGIATGNYAGRVQEQSSARSAEVKMNIRHVTADGRVTATVESPHARPSCAKRLPLNGIVLPDGDMRLTVDDGAAEGCERTYHVKVAPGGGLSGTYLDGRAPAGKAASVQR
jgi:hypothetical protein